MNRPNVIVMSAREALRYVMSHFCEPGVTEYPENTDTYAAISIQDTVSGGFGFELKENEYCKAVLTLYFDDIERPERGLKRMAPGQAKQIVDFIEANKNVDTLLIHCFAGFSRSRAVGVFAREYLGISPTDDKYFNNHVYKLLKKAVEKGEENEL